MLEKYDPHSIEKTLYDQWEEAGYFAPSGEGTPYSIVIPPPNVTGNLHMGHAFQHTLIDILIRYHRMLGSDTLWQVGTDHAGIATQMLVERQLEAEGQSRKALGRDAFLERIWQWRTASGGQICQQLRRMGSSVDWQTERFTMDEGYQQAVLEAFNRLYDEGLIYRGNRLVNWDPALQTAISDLEVENTEQQGSLWSIRYPLVNGAKTQAGEAYLVVATTRPETMLGDTAVAVHPEDRRYQHLIGQKVRLPLAGRLLPIIADDYVDPAFGTGCVKITPAHDFNDYQVGLRHQLEIINVLTTQAALNDLVPEAFRGMDRYVARKAILKALAADDLLEKTQPHLMTIPKGDRSGAVIEPMLTTQWYLSMEALAAPAIAAVRDGRVRFTPKNYENIYFAWLEEIQDWCISRQQWWGHRIPAWYDDNGNIYVGQDEAGVRAKYQLDDQLALHQEEDVLETWFSSALWSFASLGWPNESAQLERYHPTHTLVTGHDIIFFWVARMIMLSLKLRREVPFHHVYVHGLVRDAEGRKMSKTQGNGLDPIDLIDGIELEPLVAKRTANLIQPKMVNRIEKETRKEYPDGIPAFGTDALRFTFCALASTGRDVPFDLKRIAGYQHFCNKIWHAARFVLSQVKDQDLTRLKVSDLHFSLADQWIEGRFRQCLKSTVQAIDDYRFDRLANTLYEFTWHQYCDWYLELTKASLTDSSTDAAARTASCYQLLRILEALLRALHPVIPFITEHLWRECARHLGLDAITLMHQRYPEVEAYQATPLAEQRIGWLRQVVTGIRTIRSELDVAPGRRLKLLLQSPNPDDRVHEADMHDFIKKTAGVEEILWLDEKDQPPPASVQVLGDLKILIPLAGLIDKDTELSRLDKLIDKETKYLTQVQKQLTNKGFTAKAPPAVVEEKRLKAAESQAKLEKLKAQRTTLEALEDAAI